MFIRYNQGAKYYEYDTSAAQNGSGPWVILPLDGHPAGPLPGNVAYTDRTNNFIAWQKIAAGYPVILLVNTAQAADAKNWRMENLLHFYISSTNDADNAYQVRFTFGRDGSLDIPGGLSVGLGVTAGGIIRTSNYVIGGAVASQGNNGHLRLYDTSGPANGRQWGFLQPNTGDLYLQSQDDAGNGQANVIQFIRNGPVVFTPYIQCNGGAYFPNLTSNASILDRYEEGSWTPTLYSTGGGGGTAYAVQDGRYTRIGQVVTVHYQIQLTAANWADGALQLGGLPYAASEMYTHGVMDYWTTTQPFYDVRTHLSPNNTACYFIARSQPTGTGHDIVLTVPYWSGGNVWRGNFTYRTTT